MSSGAMEPAFAGVATAGAGVEEATGACCGVAATGWNAGADGIAVGDATASDCGHPVGSGCFIGLPQWLQNFIAAGTAAPHREHCTGGV